MYSERSIYEFSVLEDGAIFIDWLDTQSKNPIIRGRQVTFILDESIENSRDFDYLEKFRLDYQAQSEKYKAHVRNTLKFYRMGETRRVDFLNALRTFSKTGSLADLESVCDIADFIKVLRIFEYNWTSSIPFYMSSAQEGLRDLVVTAGCTLAFMLGSSIFNPLLVLGVVLPFSLYVCCLDKSFVIKNYILIQVLRETVGEDLFDEIYYGDEFDKEEEMPIDRSFGDIMEKDVEFLREAYGEECSAEIDELEELKKAYLERCGESSREQIASFIMKFWDKELDVYTKDVTMGLKPQCADHLSLDNLYAMFEAMGCARETWENDSFLQTLIQTVEVLIDKPFHGVEAEILRIYKIALTYVCDTKNCSKGNTSSYEDEMSRALVKQNNAEIYTDLISDLTDIEEAIKRDKIGFSNSQPTEGVAFQIQKNT